MLRPIVLHCRLAVVSLAAALSAQGAAASADPQALIRAALARWVEAANRGDYAATLDVWAPDLIGWAPEGADDSYARERAAAARAAGPVATTYALTIDEVIVEGSLAVVRDTWTQTTRPAQGSAHSETFRSFEIWRRQEDGQWRISRWIDGPTRPVVRGA